MQLPQLMESKTKSDRCFDDRTDGQRTFNVFLNKDIMLK